MNTSDSFVDPEAKAFLFLVNPTLAYDPYPDWARWIPQLARGETVTTTWNTGTRRRGVKPGDRGVVVKVGMNPKGAIGVATATSEIWVGPHWNPEAKRTETGFVDIRLDALLPVDEPISLAELKLIAPHIRWTPRMSGTEIPLEAVLAVEELMRE
ncbi:MAG: hypothetical protein U0P48_00055 [Ancrocorticia sp.]